MSIERKKYWKEGPQWKCEKSYYHPATENVSTAFVSDVSEDEVPEADKAAHLAAMNPVSTALQADEHPSEDHSIEDISIL